MARMKLRATVGVVAALALCVLIQNANASAVIFNTGIAATSTVAMGINDQGHNNVVDPTFTTFTSNSPGGAFGLAIFRSGSWRDATAPGCACEGWGLSGTVDGTARSMYANVSVDGVVNVSLDSFTTDAGPGTGSMATSNVHMTNEAGFKITQAYAPSATVPGVFFEDKVTITNTTGFDITDLRYVRVMDWDIPDTEFDEFVTILGTSTTSLLEFSNDQGFATANPLAGDPIAILGGTTNTDFTDSGSADHGAYFRFNFGSLADGESFSFSIFYGVATSEAAANAAVAAEGIELFSYGQPSSAGGASLGVPNTFIFGFKGVGGVPVLTGVPLPGASLMGFALLGLLGVGRRLRRKQA